MQIVTKNLKIARSLSEETTAYTATIYVDGVATFAASNHGHGGCDMFHTLPTAKVTEAQVNEWLAANVAPDGPYEADPAARAPWDTGHSCTLESFVGRIIEAQEAETERKRVAKKFDKLLSGCVAILRDGQLFTVKALPTAANLTVLKLREQDKGGTILNDADDATKAKGLLAYCPDLPPVGGEDLEEAVYARFREGRTTLADARYMLVANDRAAKPCPDTRAHLLDVIATQEAAERAYRDDQMQRRARDAAGATIGQVS